MATGPVIRLRDLQRTYAMGRNEVRALAGIDLEVAPGEMIAIMGASGSGKSTLMNILGCLDRPTAGTYELDGRRVDQLGGKELADIRNQRIGFVFQGFNLLPRTSAQENVELPLLYDRAHHHRDIGRAATAALERVGLGDRRDHVPNELSGGQQQRVAIARALVTEPALLLADEPTGNLDTHTSIEILALFQALNDRGLTVVMVTHELDLARYVRRVVELRDGRLVRDEAVRDRRDAAADLAAGAASAAS
ncbi:MAG TPA: ABC transporter ATP-binding protein [Candidatus Krumholzibacteria bacterium]|nr:ABC transporter ATP-binding protein [Candidatus Krumholzibacteria bacterium]HPD72424.1 ABC transporter ATP-binding protein [Candidatus Krumholzibacteria bacterium]HRY40644.1 ABC transporter ATP-binding protein [Candidatus Krumholzibacteria bacterium]